MGGMWWHTEVMPTCTFAWQTLAIYRAGVWVGSGCHGQTRRGTGALGSLGSGLGNLVAFSQVPKVAQNRLVFS